MYLLKNVEKTVDVPLSEEEVQAAEAKEQEDRKEKEDKGEKVEEPSEPVPRTKKATVKEDSWDQVNSSKPMWLQDPTKVQDQDYKDFYKTLTGFSDTPASWTHFTAEGDINFKSIMFIRGSKPQSMGGDRDTSQKTKINL